jgi:hypothetical protein
LEMFFQPLFFPVPVFRLFCHSPVPSRNPNENAGARGKSMAYFSPQKRPR